MLVGVRTSEVAARARVNPQTLRYYERRGLLPEPARSPAGYRAYGPQAVQIVQIVQIIKRAQDLGFAHDDVESPLELADGGPEGARRPGRWRPARSPIWTRGSRT